MLVIQGPLFKAKHRYQGMEGYYKGGEKGKGPLFKRNDLSRL